MELARYYRRVASRAWSETKSLLDMKGFVVTGVLWFVIGAVSFASREGIALLGAEASTWWHFTLVPFGTILVVVLVAQAVRSPALLDRDIRADLGAASRHIREQFGRKREEFLARQSDAKHELAEGAMAVARDIGRLEVLWEVTGEAELDQRLLSEPEATVKAFSDRIHRATRYAPEQAAVFLEPCQKLIRLLDLAWNMEDWVVMKSLKSGATALEAIMEKQAREELSAMIEYDRTYPKPPAM